MCNSSRNIRRRTPEFKLLIKSFFNKGNIVEIMKLPFLLFCLILQEAVCEFVTLGYVALSVAVAYYFKDTFSDTATRAKDITLSTTTFGKYYEYCDNPWVGFNVQGLKRDLQKSVFGQHIVENVVPAAVAASVIQKYHSKPLVMSFHGWPGGGKNYVANFIVQNYFKNGVKSRFFHYINSRIHFPLESQIPKYQDELRRWVYHNVSSCPHSMFVFDEVDKMPPKILDGIKPFLDHHDQIDHVDFRHAIFIFLSNSGGSLITEKYLDLWKQGVTREQMTLDDFESVIGKGVFNQKGGLYMSDVIDHSLVDHFVPFLPLEKNHVIQCIKAELSKHGFSVKEDIVNEVMKSVTFGPKPEALFSSNGCKRLSQKVATIVQRERMKKRSYEV